MELVVSNQFVSSSCQELERNAGSSLGVSSETYLPYRASDLYGIEKGHRKRKGTGL